MLVYMLQVSEFCKMAEFCKVPWFQGTYIYGRPSRPQGGGVRGPVLWAEMQEPCQPVNRVDGLLPFLAIFGHFLAIIGHYWPLLTIIDHYWLPGGRAIANILSLRL